MEEPMDPDAALDELLDLTEPLLDINHPGSVPEPATLSRIAELVDALDGWLLLGGHLPRRWTGGTRR
jgi:hypothetical protein